jgi:hypothetical protein
MTTQTPTKPTAQPSGAVPRPRTSPEGRSTRQSQQAPFAPSAFYPPDQPAPVPREPGLTDPHHRLLQTLTSPEVSTITLCEIHTLTLAQIAELTGSQTFEDALAAAERIAQFRLRLLKLEAEQLAWARLTDLARRHPVTPREQETSRKAAAQILRETKKPATPESSPVPNGGGAGAQRRRRGKPADTPDPTQQHTHDLDTKAPHGGHPETQRMEKRKSTNNPNPTPHHTRDLDTEIPDGSGPGAQRRGSAPPPPSPPPGTPPQQSPGPG